MLSEDESELKWIEHHSSRHSTRMKQQNENAVVVSVIDLIAGSMGGCANVLVGQPLDTVKVKMQTFPHLYRNAFGCFRETFAKDGIRRGLYAGSVPALIANVAENSVLFCAYGVCQKAVQYMTRNPDSSPVEKAFAGSLAAFFASFTLCPTELIKCKLQALRESGKAYSKIGPFKLTSTILRTEGIRGMFKGLTPTLAREMPGYFFFFGGYELSKSVLTNFRMKHATVLSSSASDGNAKHDAGLLVTVVSGGFGGVCFWTAIFPFDVVKSRVQVESSSASMVSLLTSIGKTEGIRGLYKGLLPTVLRTFPSTGALFVAYEYTKLLLTDGAQKMHLL